MPVAFLVELPDITMAQYDAVVADLDPAWLQSLLFHVAGPYDGGLRIVDVWESQEAWDLHTREHLIPLLAKHRLATPSIQSWPVHNLLAG